MGNRKLKFLLLFVGVFVLIELALFCFQPLQDQKSSKLMKEVGIIVAQRGNNLPINVKVNSNPHSNINELFENVTENDINSLFSPLKKLNKSERKACENVVNLHIWHEICGLDVKNLKLYPLYPHLPAVRETVNKLDFNEIAPLFGIRIFGYLLVKRNALTQFMINTVDINIEVYLSYNSPNNSFLICDQNYLTNQGTPLSKEIYLKKGKYFFEILGKTGIKHGKFSLTWKQSKSGISSFHQISSDHLGCFFNETVHRTSVVLDYKVPEGLPSLFVKKKLSELYSTVEDFRRSTIFNIPLIPEEDVLDLFPECKYSPSYIVRQDIPQFLGVWELHYTKVFPRDMTEVLYRLDTNDDQVIFGNDVLLESTAHSVVNQIMVALKTKHNK